MRRYHLNGHGELKEVIMKRKIEKIEEVRTIIRTLRRRERPSLSRLACDPLRNCASMHTNVPSGSGTCAKQKKYKQR